MIRLRPWQWGPARRLSTQATSSPSAAAAAANQHARSVVRCRFAPSPTGQLHLGGLRTALFNVLMVRSSAPGSRFILRIDDTDRNRYVEGAVESLVKTLRWAGLDWDEGPDKDSSVGPFFQSMRLSLYREYIDRLLREGNAYRDFRPPSSEEVASQAGVRLAPYLPPSESEAQEMIQAGKAFVVRLKMPERTIPFEDLVFGKFNLDPRDLGNDPILLKSDGWPTYHLANAVDDIEMQITHVFRGEEWLPSVGKHLALFDALGATPPHFAHLPLLINPDGSKLSKRSGDAHVQAYIDKGYEPEALINFVGLMGYNHQNAGSEAAAEGAEQYSEVMSLDDLIRDFEVSRIARSRASPFFPKLDFLNRQHVRRIVAASPSTTASQRRIEVLDRARAELVAAFGEQASLSEDKMAELVTIIGERATTLRDLPDEARFLFEDPDWQGEAAKKLLGGILAQKNNPKGADVGAVMKQVLERYSDALKDVSAESGDPMQKVVPAVLEAVNSHNERSGQPAWKSKALSTLAKKTLRWAVSGGKPGPAVADLIPIMGRKKMLLRLQSARQALDASLATVSSEK
ncbi:Glutamate--tRNA ligase mitochondrial [Tilletia horrida]|nr:Glutamate--tRNA ligase mitochondrial [Tilletia horrida]